jgi:hypothetical protein
MFVSKALAAKAGAVVATLAIGVTGVTAAASASTAKPKTGTELTAKAGPGHVRKHSPHFVDSITGQLTSTSTPAGDVTGARIVLKRETKKGHWVVEQFGRTGRFGKVRFRVRGLKHGATFELVFRGNKNFSRSHSAPIVIAPVTK